MPRRPASFRTLAASIARVAPVAALAMFAFTFVQCEQIAGLGKFKSCPEDPGCPALGGTCTDGEKNGAETDVDCGGSVCNDCGDGMGCANGADCTSKVCTGGTCIAPACGDMVRNGDEADVDCGGATCPKCGVGEGCAVDADCAGGTCGGDKKCAATCTDGVKDGDEADVDCGGAECPKCMIDAGCGVGADCETGVCEGNMCVSNYVWAKQFGDGQDQFGTALVTDPLGQSFVLSTVSGAVDFGGGPLTASTSRSLAAAKFDSSGNLVWGKVFSAHTGKFSGGTNGAAVDKYGNLAFAGSVDGAADFGGVPPSGVWGPGNAFIAKLNPSGQHVWSKEISMGNAAGVAFHVDDHPVVTGSLSSPSTDFGCGALASSGPNGTDAFVVSYYAGGVCAWSKRFGNDNLVITSRIVTDSNWDVTVMGSLSGTVDFGNGPIVGPSTDDKSVFVAKIGAGGAALWSKTFGVPGSTQGTMDLPTGLAVDSLRNIYVAGYFQGTIDLGNGPLVSAGGWDIFVVKLDSAGNALWSKRFGDSSSQSVYNVAVDTADNLLLAGSFAGSVDFGGGALFSDGPSYAFVAKLDSAGQHIWSRRFGSVQVSEGTAIAPSGATGIVVTGDFLGQIDFGGGPLTTMGGSDGFLAKLLVP